MSRFAIPAIAAANLDLAASAEIGLENRVFYSLGDTKSLGKLEQDAADAATLTLDPAYTAPASLAVGYDLQAVLRHSLLSPDGDFAAVLNVKFAGGTITGATLASPSVITTSAAHGLETADVIDITGITGSGATGLNGTGRVVTKISSTTFSVALNASGAGTGGTFAKHGTATVTFSAPQQATDQGSDLPQGLAVDITGDSPDASREIRELVSVDSVTNGGPGTIIEFYSLPESDTFVEIGCTEDKNPTLPSPEPIRIPCGDQAARWTKMGRETDPSLSLSTKYRGYADGLPRLNGQRFVTKIEVRKDKRILSERMIFIDCIGKLSMTKGDGNAVSMAKLECIFSTVAVFC